VDPLNHLAWQKSSFSGGGDGAECVEVAGAEGKAAIREGDAPGRVLQTERGLLAALIRRLKSGV
jgi:hypothetical protein